MLSSPPLHIEEIKNGLHLSARCRQIFDVHFFIWSGCVKTSAYPCPNPWISPCCTYKHNSRFEERVGKRQQNRAVGNPLKDLNFGLEDRWKRGDGQQDLWGRKIPLLSWTTLRILKFVIFSRIGQLRTNIVKYIYSAASYKTSGFHELDSVPLFFIIFVQLIFNQIIH